MPPTPPSRETRSIAFRLAAAPEGKTLSGYAAVFDEPTEINEWGFRFTEVIRKGAFARSLASGQDILASYNHDPINHLLGRSSSGTATFVEDDHGLKFSIALPDTETGREVSALALRGDLVGASFVFMTPPGGDRWPGPTYRELVDVDLIEAGPVVTPAYAATSLALRAANRAASGQRPPAVPLQPLRLKLDLLLKPRG